MLLLLMRHGPAGKRTTGEEDIFRALTKAGAKKIITAAKGMKRLLQVPEKTLIFTSELSRSVQTGDIVAAEFAVKHTEMCSALTDADIEDIRSLLSANSDVDLMVIVGHEPSISRVCQQLTGSRLFFKKGAAAAVSIDSSQLRLQQPKAELIWFLQPAALRRLAE